MRKFNIYFTLKGPGGEAETPNKNNPIEAKCIADLFSSLSIAVGRIEVSEFGLLVTGVRIDEVV